MGEPAPTTADEACQPELWPPIPERLVVRIEVTDPEVVAALYEIPAGPERDRFAREALRIGVISLRTASGQIAAGAVRAAGDRLVADLRELLAARATEMTSEMAQ